jgi:hypothetical protein
MGSGSGTAVVQRTAPTSTVIGWDARPRPPDRGHLAQQPRERAPGPWGSGRGQGAVRAGAGDQ